MTKQEPVSHVGKERMDRLLKEMEGRNLWQEIFDMRDEQRKYFHNGVWLVKGKDLPLENNKQGLMRWYMHPRINSTVLKSLMIYVQEIPPGSRSGRLKCQGNIPIYIMEGEGYTVIDGTKHYWGKWDVVQIPIRLGGVVFQHFNTDKEKTAKLIVCEPNLFDSAGVDRGSGFEQLEVSPDYKE